MDIYTLLKLLLIGLITGAFGGLLADSLTGLFFMVAPWI